MKLFNSHKGFLFLILIPLSFIFYFEAIDNFFVWYDFYWLYRGKYLLRNPYEAFALDTYYYDPLVYLVFWFNFKLFGTNHAYYHIFDIAIHSLNALLVSCIVFKLSKNRLLSFLSGLFFATSFATAHAVIYNWARVDLFCVLFSLLALIAYMKFLESGNKTFYFLSLLSFVFAMSSKGTAIVLPIFLIITVWQVKRNITEFKKVVPFILFSIIYLAVVFTHSNTGPLGNGFNLAKSVNNFAVGTSALFLPKQIVEFYNYLPHLFVALLFLIALLAKKPVISFGFMLMATGTLPLLHYRGVLKLVGSDSPLHHSLTSPSHRIYLASIGASILLAAIIEWVLSNTRLTLFKKPLLCLIVAFVLWVNYSNIQIAERQMELASSAYVDFVDEMKTTVPDMREGSTLIFFSKLRFGGTFVLPMLKIFYDIDDLQFLSMPDIPDTLPDDPRLVNTVPPINMYAFITTGVGNKIIDVSKNYNRALEIAYRYRFTKNIEERDEYKKEYSNVASQLNHFIRVYTSQ